MAAITNDRFWDKIEEAVGPIDLHIKNALQIQEMAQPYFFKNLEPSKIRQVESFIKSDTYLQLLPNNENLVNYYGSFYENPRDFRFSVEDLNKIHDIKHFVKSKPKEYWIEENNNLEPPQKKK